MATREGVAKAFVLLRRAYPDHVGRHLASSGAMAEQADFYMRFFQDVEDEVLIGATLQHISRSQWWPKVAELRASAFDLITQKLDAPTSYEAWGNVKACISYPPGQEPWLSPFVKEVMDACGGMTAFRMSPQDAETAWRARFVQAYDTMLKRRRDTSEMLPEIKALAERLRLGAGEHRQIEGAK